MRRSTMPRLVAAVSLCAVLVDVAGADVLLDQTKLIAAPTVAPGSELSFTAGTAQALTVTLTDLKQPAAFQALQVAVTVGDAVVGTVSVDATTGVGTLALPANTGTYALHVVGTPDATQNRGSFSACVAPTATPTSCIAADSFSDTLLTPGTPSTTPSTALDTNFTSTTAGAYTVNVSDDAFPAALQSLSGGIGQGSTPIVQLGLGATQVTLAADTSYSLIIGALADATIQAGLYGVHITDPSGAAVYDRTIPVGLMGSSTSVKNPSAQPLTLTLTDFQYPAALTTVGVALTAGGAPAAGALTATGTTTFPAPAGSLEVWKFASATSQPGVYGISLAGTSASLLSATQVVNPGNAAATGAYAFVVNLPATGTYQLLATDFQFPSALTSLSATIAQNGSVLTEDSTGTFSGVAGPAVVLANAQAPSTGDGIFAVTVQSTATPATVLLDQTQAVGGVFDTRSITVGTFGDYDVTLTDLAFPAKFANLAVVLSEGTQVLGKIYGGGTFPVNVQPGQYVLTFVATPSTTEAVATNDNYGLYAIKMSSTAPTITFTASAATVTAGQPVQLTWSTNDATVCTASGATGWAGSEATSGTAAVVVTAATTLTLTCTGAGGSATQSVAVATTPTPSSGGGGGSLSPAWLLLLAGFAVRRHRQLAT